VEAKGTVLALVEKGFRIDPKLLARVLLKLERYSGKK